MVQRDDLLLLQSVHVLLLLSATLLSRNLAAKGDLYEYKLHLETQKNVFLKLYFIFDLPADLLQRLLLGLGEGQFGGDGVAFGHQGPALLLGEDERS